MAKSSSMSIRIDPEIKSQADSVLNYLGMTTSEAVNIFLRQVVLNNGLPFPVKAPSYKEETLRAIDDVRNRRNLSRPFNSTTELLEDLDADD